MVLKALGQKRIFIHGLLTCPIASKIQNQILHMKKCLVIILTFYFITISFGQSTFKKNDIYFEAGGNALFGSVNYERQLTKEPGIGARIGIGAYSENAFYLTIPVGINYLFKLKKDNRFIDAGLGIAWARRNGELFHTNKKFKNEHFVNFIPSIGYRAHTANNVMWRISLTPVANKHGLTPWLGASVGKRF